MSWIFNQLARKLLADKLVDSLAAEDPYYENVEEEAVPGKKTKKQIKRELPQGLSQNDERVLRRMRRRAYCLDLVFKLCGCRAGWTAVIGFIPVIGPIINIYLGMALVNLAASVDGGIPASVRSKMVTNVTIDFGLGFTPFLGDIAGAIYKSNSRNYLILERHLRSKYGDSTNKNNNRVRGSSSSHQLNSTDTVAAGQDPPPPVPPQDAHIHTPPGGFPQNTARPTSAKNGQESGVIG